MTPRVWKSSHTIAKDEGLACLAALQERCLAQIGEAYSACCLALSIQENQKPGESN